MFEQTLASSVASPAPRKLTFLAAGLLEGLLVTAVALHTLIKPEVLAPSVPLARFGAAEPPPPPPPTDAPTRPPGGQTRLSSEKALPHPLIAPPEPPTRQSPAEASAPAPTPAPGMGAEGGGPSFLQGETAAAFRKARPVFRASEALPLRPLFQPSPVYPAAAAAMGLSSRVLVGILVDETGAVREAWLVESSNRLFEEAAFEAVRPWRYSRPVDARSRAPVLCLLTVTVYFRLR